MLWYSLFIVFILCGLTALSPIFPSSSFYPCMPLRDPPTTTRVPLRHPELFLLQVKCKSSSSSTTANSGVMKLGFIIRPLWSISEYLQTHFYIIVINRLLLLELNWISALSLYVSLYQRPLSNSAIIFCIVTFLPFSCPFAMIFWFQEKWNLGNLLPSILMICLWYLLWCFLQSKTYCDCVPKTFTAVSAVEFSFLFILFCVILDLRTDKIWKILSVLRIKPQFITSLKVCCVSRPQHVWAHSSLIPVYLLMSMLHSYCVSK